MSSNFTLLNGGTIKLKLNLGLDNLAFKEVNSGSFLNDSLKISLCFPDLSSVE